MSVPREAADSAPVANFCRAVSSRERLGGPEAAAAVKLADYAIADLATRKGVRERALARLPPPALSEICQLASDDHGQHAFRLFFVFLEGLAKSEFLVAAEYLGAAREAAECCADYHAAACVLRAHPHETHAAALAVVDGRKSVQIIGADGEPRIVSRALARQAGHHRDTSGEWI